MNEEAKRIRGRDLISTFTAAKMLFPDEPFLTDDGKQRKKMLRRVERLCQTNQLECLAKMVVGEWFFPLRREKEEWSRSPTLTR